MQFSTSEKLRSLRFFFSSALLGCGEVFAQTPATVKTEMPAYLEAGVSHHKYSAGYEHWNGQFARGAMRSDSSNVWNAEIANVHQFADNSTLIAIGNTHEFNDRWYSMVSASGSNGYFFPRLRLDVSGTRKWLAQRNFLTTVGLSAINAKDGHQDRSLLLSWAYYFKRPWVLEGGIRLNQSNPGRVSSDSRFIAATYGIDKQQVVSLRYGEGQEAYQYIGADAFLVDFKSNIWTGTWRKWMRPQLGFQVRVESYHNQYYDRHGIEISAFKEF
jgi:YaiO family outer membrane protein